MLLPFHRLSFSNNDLFSSFTNRPSFLQNKLIFRWIALACVTIAFIWVANSALAPRLELPLNPPLQPTKEEQAVWELRKNEVRNAFKHAWSGYKTIAYPDDELCPISGRTSNKLSPSFFFSFFLSIDFYFIYKKRFNGWGVTLFDSLSTMWIMDLREEFEEAVDSIRDIQFNTTKVKQLPHLYH